MIRPSSTLKEAVKAIIAVKDVMPMLECFVVLIDDRTMKCLDDNSCRCDICRISSTLVQLTVCEDWGGKMLGETYLPYWTDLAEAGISIGELTKCRCNP